MMDPRVQAIVDLAVRIGRMPVRDAEALWQQRDQPGFDLAIALRAGLLDDEEIQWLGAMVDRGVSQEEVAAMLTQLELEGTTHANLFFGLLTSAFVIGFSIAGIVFGNLMHKKPPFFVTGMGLIAWTAAAVFAGLARPLKSYTLLLVMRMFSGIGEAGFQARARVHLT